MREAYGNLYLLPLPLGQGAVNTLSLIGTQKLNEIEYFIAERARTFRRFLKEISPEINFEGIEIYEWEKGMREKEMEDLLLPLAKGNNVGIVSEAGCPGIADPGAMAVKLAHKHGFKVIPIPGPSSIFLAIMGSGFNGQQFKFNGYLPRDKRDLQNKLLQLEKSVTHTGLTEIFIETPYRNENLFDTALRCLQNETNLALAVDLTLPEQWIKRDTIGNWKKKSKPSLHKRPTVFLLGI